MINHSYKITIIILFYFAGCSSKTNEWIILFDGQKVEGMRGYKMSDFPWQGWEIKDEIDAERTGNEAARQALVNLSAKACPSGRMPVVLGNGFGGVIFHEACGHLLQ